MKTIGLLGGMSWESTSLYYSKINNLVKERMGGLHSAKIILNSVDFAEIEALQHQGNWQKTAEILTDCACGVEKAGADFLLICTNTMHKVAPQIENQISIPLLHIGDATGSRLKHDSHSCVGLLGTKFTMEEEFYKDRIISNHGIDVVIPNETQRKIVHNVIYKELCQGKILAESKQQYLEIINDLTKLGAQAVILGCTEIALLVKQPDTDVPLYDTTAIHAEESVRIALR